MSENLFSNIIDWLSHDMVSISKFFLIWLVFSLLGWSINKYWVLTRKDTLLKEHINFKFVLTEVIAAKLWLLGFIVGLFWVRPLLEITDKYDLLFGKANGFLLAVWCGVFMVQVIARGSNLLFSKDSHLQGMSIIKALLIVLVSGLITITYLSFVGIDITPALAALGVGGLAVALALQDTLGNLFAGIQIILSRKFKPHSYVMIPSLSLEGTVRDITLRYTTLENLRNELVIVPNSVFSQASVVNISMPKKEFTFIVKFSVVYSSNLKKVEKITTEVIKNIMQNTKGGSQNFPGAALTWEFGDSGIEFLSVLKGKNYAQHRGGIKSAFIKELHERFDLEGIEFAFPTRTLYLKKNEPESDVI
ncbi:MAG: mechanosensitive ion channel family protein [SAR324 cluster bacterium]|nr:mechanosensitive ion channel family protein [SAR324 cluster bacterium]